MAWISATVIRTALGSLYLIQRLLGLFCFGGYVYWDFAAQFQGIQLTEKTKTMLMVLLARSSSEFLSLTLLCSATNRWQLLSCDLDRLFCGGGL